MSQDPPNNNTALATMATWVTTIADKVNNPVAGITTTLTLIEREMAAYRDHGTFQQDLVDDALVRIRKRLVSLAQYVTELVEVARPSPPRPKLFALKNVLESLVQLPAPHNSSQIVLAIGSNAELVFADEIQLRLVLRALINNAWEASSGLDGPSPRLQISAQRLTLAGSDGVAITIEDNGPGFDPRFIKRVTEPFFSTKEASSGLGLAIAQQFAEVHQGSIRLSRSMALGGAAVTMFLPSPANT